MHAGMASPSASLVVEGMEEDLGEDDVAHVEFGR